jgi:hypothetical protein
MEKSRSRFKTADLENSIDPSCGGTEGTIHDGENFGRVERMQLLIFGGPGSSRASPREIGVLSKREKTSKKESINQKA